MGIRAIDNAYKGNKRSINRERKRWSCKEEQGSIKLTNRQTERNGVTEKNKPP